MLRRLGDMSSEGPWPAWASTNLHKWDGGGDTLIAFTQAIAEGGHEWGCGTYVELPAISVLYNSLVHCALLGMWPVISGFARGHKS